VSSSNAELLEPTDNLARGMIPIFATLLTIMIMGPSRPWSDRYLFFPFNYLQRLSTWKVLSTLKGIELVIPVIFRTSLVGRSTRSVGRESFGVKRSVRVGACTNVRDYG